MTMGTTHDWGRLYAQGRCKAIGISWTDEESKAVFIKKIPAEYVRLGILSYSEFLERKAKDDAMTVQPLIKRGKEELLKMAHEAGLNATSDASKETLVLALENKVNVLEEQKEKEEAKAKAEVESKTKTKAKAEVEKIVKVPTPKVEKSENKPNK